MAKKRDYKKEYADYHSKPEQKANRAMRNSARATLIKEGKVKKGDGMEVDHKNPLSKGGTNCRRNWKVVTKEENRKKGNKKGNKK